MQVSTAIYVGTGNFAGDEAWAASQALAALGGNPANDTSTARIERPNLVFSVSVTLEDGDAFQYTPDAAAQQILAALGGNPTTDTCDIIISMPGSSGHAGVDT